ncbi:hypothetical protein GEMRC1_010625 [Eukaryota sp. GEM-RC1]
MQYIGISIGEEDTSIHFLQDGDFLCEVLTNSISLDNQNLSIGDTFTEDSLVTHIPLHISHSLGASSGSYVLPSIDLITNSNNRSTVLFNFTQPIEVSLPTLLFLILKHIRVDVLPHLLSDVDASSHVPVVFSIPSSFPSSFQSLLAALCGNCDFDCRAILSHSSSSTFAFSSHLLPQIPRDSKKSVPALIAHISPSEFCLSLAYLSPSPATKKSPFSVKLKTLASKVSSDIGSLLFDSVFSSHLSSFFTDPCDSNDLMTSSARMRRLLARKETAEIVVNGQLIKMTRKDYLDVCSEVVTTISQFIFKFMRDQLSALHFSLGFYILTGDETISFVSMITQELFQSAPDKLKEDSKYSKFQSYHTVKDVIVAQNSEYLNNFESGRGALLYNEWLEQNTSPLKIDKSSQIELKSTTNDDYDDLVDEYIDEYNSLKQSISLRAISHSPSKRRLGRLVSDIKITMSDTETEGLSEIQHSARETLVSLTSKADSFLGSRESDHIYDSMSEVLHPLFGVFSSGQVNQSSHKHNGSQDDVMAEHVDVIFDSSDDDYTLEIAIESPEDIYEDLSQLTPNDPGSYSQVLSLCEKYLKSDEKSSLPYHSEVVLLKAQTLVRQSLWKEALTFVLSYQLDEDSLYSFSVQLVCSGKVLLSSTIVGKLFDYLPDTYSIKLANHLLYSDHFNKDAIQVLSQFYDDLPEAKHYLALYHKSINNIPKFESEIKSNVERKYSESLFHYGKYLLTSTDFVDDDVMSRDAFELLIEAADLDSVDAVLFLGLIHLSGFKGIAADYSKCLEYFTIAADKGHKHGKLLLAYCYDIGLGCDSDPDQSQSILSELYVAQSESLFDEHLVSLDDSTYVSNTCILHQLLGLFLNSNIAKICNYSNLEELHEVCSNLVASVTSFEQLLYTYFLCNKGYTEAINSDNYEFKIRFLKSRYILEFELGLYQKAIHSAELVLEAVLEDSHTSKWLEFFKCLENNFGPVHVHVFLNISKANITNIPTIIELYSSRFQLMPTWCQFTAEYHSFCTELLDSIDFDWIDSSSSNICVKSLLQSAKDLQSRTRMNIIKNVLFRGSLSGQVDLILELAINYYLGLSSFTQNPELGLSYFYHAVSLDFSENEEFSINSIEDLKNPNVCYQISVNYKDGTKSRQSNHAYSICLQFAAEFGHSSAAVELSQTDPQSPRYLNLAKSAADNGDFNSMMLFVKNGNLDYLDNLLRYSSPNTNTMSKQLEFLLNFKSTIDSELFIETLQRLCQNAFYPAYFYLAMTSDEESIMIEYFQKYIVIEQFDFEFESFYPAQSDVVDLSQKCMLHLLSSDISEFLKFSNNIQFSNIFTDEQLDTIAKVLCDFFIDNSSEFVSKYGTNSINGSIFQQIYDVVSTINCDSDCKSYVIGLYDFMSSNSLGDDTLSKIRSITTSFPYIDFLKGVCIFLGNESDKCQKSHGLFQKDELFKVQSQYFIANCLVGMNQLRDALEIFKILADDGLLPACFEYCRISSDLKQVDDNYKKFLIKISNSESTDVSHIFPFGLHLLEEVYVPLMFHDCNQRLGILTLSEAVESKSSELFIESRQYFNKSTKTLYPSII